jgi:uncharacterized membrane protein
MLLLSSSQVIVGSGMPVASHCSVMLLVVMVIFVVFGWLIKAGNSV